MLKSYNLQISPTIRLPLSLSTLCVWVRIYVPSLRGMQPERRTKTYTGLSQHRQQQDKQQQRPQPHNNWVRHAHKGLGPFCAWLLGPAVKKHLGLGQKITTQMQSMTGEQKASSNVQDWQVAKVKISELWPGRSENIVMITNYETFRVRYLL